MELRSLGIDLGKTTFHLVALNAAGKVRVAEEVHPKAAHHFYYHMQSSLIGMEACSGAHFLARVLREQGHNVKLIPAQFVKPFVKSNKNESFLARSRFSARSSSRRKSIGLDSVSAVGKTLSSRGL
jgi:transposase